MKAEIIKHLYAHLPANSYNSDEMNVKAGAVFSHIYSAGLVGGAPMYH